MTPELTVLALAFLLRVAQFVAFAIPANMEMGPGYTMSARDRPPSKPMSDRTLRMQRALNNHFEGLLLFAVAVTLVTLSGQATAFTAACGWVYLIARVAYVPAYVLGWRPGRSLIWAVGFTATLLMVISTLI
jgi:uncharacterized MAPEG superfamily protein